MNLTEAKDHIKSAPISTIIGYYIPVTKRGANYEALCPFHQDTDPSLKINDSKGLFKCFACDTAGDHISFVEKLKNYEFIDAVEDIASKIGITIEKNENKNPEFEMAIRVLKAATKVYRKTATSNCSEFEEFLKNRKISAELAGQFQLGYCPKGNVFTHYLENLDSSFKKKAIDMAVKIGIIRKSSKQPGSYFDTFSERIIFPICDHSGTVRGFGSRATKEYQKAKYMNSQESFVYNKSYILYGFNLAKNPIRNQKSVLLTEGNMDAISLHQNGFANTVALMGVAMSDNQIKTLSNQADKFYLALDNDKAGFEAAKRVNADMMKQGILPYYLNFAPHKDPDDFIKAEGQLAVRKLIDEAPLFVDYQISTLFPEKIPEISEQKLEYLRQFFEVLSPLGNSLGALERVTTLAQRLGLKTDAKSITDAYKDYAHKEDNSPVSLPTPKPEPKVEVAAPAHFEISSNEKKILKSFLHYPSCIQHAKYSEILDFVEHNEVKSFIAQMEQLVLEIEDSQFVQIMQRTILNTSFPQALKEYASSCLFSKTSHELSEDKKDKLMNDLLKNCQIEKLKKERNSLRAKQIKSESQTEANNILREIHEIELKISNIKTFKEQNI